MAETTGGEKSLPASPQKKQKAREDGNVPKSQDLNSALSLLAALIAIYFLGETMAKEMVMGVAYYFGSFDRLEVDPGTVQRLAVEAIGYMARATLPIMVVLLAVSLSINVVQVGVLFAPKAIQPKLEKLNPFTGLKRFVSLRTLVELVKSILKIAVISYIVYLTARERWDELFVLTFYEPWSTTVIMAQFVMAIWWRVVVAMLILGVLDYGFQRWQHERDLRMTVQEAKEEMRQLEGDPRIRQRVRQIQRQMAMKRMMAEVPTADVIITNPTTYAVALRYDPAGMDAPKVVAKGARLIAERIRALGTEHQVPIVEKPTLARALFRTIEVGQPVPADLFRAVAEVLAYVYRIDRRAAKQRERDQAWQAQPRGAA